MRYTLVFFALILAAGSADARRRAVGPAPQKSDGGRIIAITAGGENACALRADGSLDCWGHGSYGSLGTGGFPSFALVPVRVLGGPWKAASMGGHGACAIAGDSTFCWGTDADGGLGRGLVSSGCAGTADDNSGCSAVPGEVVGGHQFVMISAGGTSERRIGPPFGRFTCGLTATGQAFCWGSDGAGELGDGEQYPARNPFPIAVATEARFTTIAAGTSHACAVDLDGRAWCWGDDKLGALGRETFGFVGAKPQPVAGNLRFTQLDAYSTHTCGITVDGDVYCWGSNGSGQLGTREAIGDCSDDPRWPMPCSTAPVKVATDRKFTDVATGLAHTCGVAADGTVFCWGRAWEVGRATPQSTACPSAATLPCVMTPIAIDSAERFSQVDAGTEFTCGLSEGGEVLCWGTDFYSARGSFTPTVIAD